MSVGLFVLALVFALLAAVAGAAALYVRVLRFPWRTHPTTVTEARTEGLLLMVLCGALLLLGLTGACFMVWVSAQVARQHPDSIAVAPLLIALACLLVAAGCGWAILQERRRLRADPREDCDDL